MWVAALGSVALVVALAVPAVASAVLRYSEPGVGGSDPACPQSDPCDLEEAVEMAAAGDEIVILSGNYSMSDPLSIGGVGTLVHGEANQPRPLLQTSGFTGVGISNTMATLRDLTIEHTGSGAGLSSIGTVERVAVRSTSALADTACSLDLLGRLRDSFCSTTAGTAPAVRVIAAGAFANTLRLRNVTAVSAGGLGLLARAQTGEDLTVDVKATVARGGAGTDVRAETDGAASTTATINLDHSNYATASTGTAGSVTAPGTGGNQTPAPLFANESAGDFHQLAGSLTINAGAVDAESGSTDIDGEPRSQGPAADIGADEFDQIAPSVSITAGPGEGETIGSPSASFEFNSDDPTATFSCEIDGGGFGACSGPGNAHTASGLGNGVHSFSVRATDAKGNASTASRSFAVSVAPTPAIDIDPPETAITRSPPNRTEKEKAKFKFRSDEPGSEFECKLDRKPFGPCTSPRIYKGLDEEKHKFLVRAIDPAGNVDPSAAKDKWTVLG
jgi:hypothetical protein